MKNIYLLLFSVCITTAYAHQPDLSSLMLFEENGKTIILLKSSLNAFEGEVEYNYKKNAYKTPQEFNQLVIHYFLENCFVVVNDDTITFANIQVQLGHETTLFAELKMVPKTIKTIYVRSTLFKDMPNNQCELILATNGLPQKQFILDNSNQQEVSLRVENNKWVVLKPAFAFNLNTISLIGLTILLILILVYGIVNKSNKK